MFYFDPLYMLVAFVGLGLSLFATARVKGAFAKYSKIPAMSGMTGAEVAQRILSLQNITGVPVQQTRGQDILGLKKDGILDDHYNPIDKTVNLSHQVYHGTSQAAVAIAAHEVGHAIQHARAYAPFKVRSALAPAAAIGSNAAYFLIMLGFVFHAMHLIKLGVIAFAIAVVFQFVTLPVEFDASNRAKKLLMEYGLVNPQDSKGVAAVLNAAALTYVAAAAAALMTLIYYMFRAGLLGGRRDD